MILAKNYIMFSTEIYILTTMHNLFVLCRITNCFRSRKKSITVNLENPWLAFGNPMLIFCKIYHYEKCTDSFTNRGCVGQISYVHVWTSLILPKLLLLCSWHFAETAQIEGSHCRFAYILDSYEQPEDSCGRLLKSHILRQMFEDSHALVGRLGFSHKKTTLNWHIFRTSTHIVHVSTTVE